MKILLTGVTGYIGKRLLVELVKNGYEVVCSVRDKDRFYPDKDMRGSIEVVEVDFLDYNTLLNIPTDIIGAYYLIHSMSSEKDYEKFELACAENFKKYANELNLKHVIYLSGIVNEKSLSKHLSSRKAVEDKLNEGDYNLTTFRAGIIIGSGSASFEIIRDLVEKLPVMITPKWLNTKCQPIGIDDVVSYLIKALFKRTVYNKNYDIGGPDILSYKDMLLGYAKARRLKRWIYTVPVMTPQLSSYWLYFITSTSYKLAVALVNSMKIEVICRKSDINRLLNIVPIGYEESINRTIREVDSDKIVSSWKDSLVSGIIDSDLMKYIKVPEFGCYKDIRKSRISNKKETINRLWRIGGDTGWYYANWLWQIRGFIDKIFGGVGLRRGRTHYEKIDPGDSIDFWRVLYANREEGNLLLFAEMKLPGDAWLEFNLKGNKLIMTATFRPKGLWGRLYWFSVMPFHGIVFKGMVRRLSA
jgi:uncharacterized protein YbjT (DUF2867 family)